MFRIYDENMNVIPFPEGVKPLDIFISSIDKERITKRLEGMDGVINYGSTFNTRTIELELLLIAKDTQDYRLLRDEVYALFQRTDTLYVSEDYEQGKRYKVAVDESFIPERIQGNRRYAEAKINCSMVDLPFSQSAGTTQDIQRDGVTFESGLWGFGMGLQMDDDTLDYTFNTTDFQVYNAGNVGIHPFMQDLKITISDVVGSSNFMEIKNVTNGTSFKIDEKVTNNQEIILDGPNITSNNLVIDPRTTNRGLIQMSPGWNNFEITGITEAVTEFDFKFYYY